MAEVKISVKNVVEGQGDVPKAAKNYELLNKNINMIAASMTAVIAAGATFKKAFDLSREGASLGQLESSFDLLNKQVLHTPGLLDAMTEAARGTIKETDLMAGVMTLVAGQSAEMAQQFASASPKLIEIAKAAQKLNPTLGDTGFLYNSLALGIKRGSPLILDNLGIVVKVGEANEKYAAALGKSVEQLTAQEKTVALLNATLAAGDTLISQVGGSVDSQTDSWDRLTVQVGTGTDAFKRNLAEGLEPWIKLVNGDYAKAIKTIEEGNIAAAEATGDYSKAQTATTAGYDKAIASIIRTSTSYKDFTNKLDVAGISIRNVHTGVGGMTEGWYENTKAVNDFNEAISHTYAVLASEMTPAIINNYTEVDDAAIALRDARVEAIAFNDATHDMPAEAYTYSAKAIERTRDNIRDAAIAERALQEETRATAEEFKKQQDASEVMRNAEFINAYTDALENQETVYGRWVTTATAVGGRTEQQEANFEDLTKRAEQLTENINSLQGGTAGLGLTQDELNEKLAKNYEELGLVQSALEPLAGMTTEYTNATKLWVVDGEAMNQTLFDQIAASSDSAIAITSAGIALGLYDETQIEAALNAAIITEKINLLAESFVNGHITASELRLQMDEIVAGSPYTSEVAVITEAAIGNLDKVRSKLKELDGYTVTSKVRVETEYVGGPPPGAGAGDSGGGSQSPGRAVGGPVMANQPYMVHANEVFIPPTAGRIESAGNLGGDITISFAGAIFQGTSQQTANSIVTKVAEQLGRY